MRTHGRGEESRTGPSDSARRTRSPGSTANPGHLPLPAAHCWGQEGAESAGQCSAECRSRCTCRVRGRQALERRVHAWRENEAECRHRACASARITARRRAGAGGCCGRLLGAPEGQAGRRRARQQERHQQHLCMRVWCVCVQVMFSCIHTHTHMRADQAGVARCPARGHTPTRIRKLHALHGCEEPRTSVPPLRRGRGIIIGFFFGWPI
jgi:hypothetical protein